MSDYTIDQIKRIRYAIEPAGSYSTNLSGTVTFKDVRAISGEFETIEEKLENQTMQQRLDNTEPKIPSRRRSSMTLESYLVGSGVAVSGSTYAAKHSQADLLSTIMGGYYVTSGSTLSGVQTAGALTQSATASDKYAGSVVGIFNSSSNRLECARVKDYNTGTRGMILEHQLPFVPGATLPVYGSANCYLAEDPDKSVQFLVEGQDSDFEFYLQGLQGNFGLTFANGELLQVSYELEGATWQTGSTHTLVEASYVEGNPLPIVDSRFLFYIHSASSAAPHACIPVNAWELTPNLTYVDVTTPCNKTNILRKRRSRSVPVAQGSFTAYFQDRSWWNALSADTRFGLAIQVGSVPGNTVYISCPYVQITEVSAVGAEELQGVQVSFEILDNRLVIPTLGNIDLARSNLSIAFL